MRDDPLPTGEAWGRVVSRIRYCLGLLECITQRPEMMGELPVQEHFTSFLLGELLTLVAGREVVHISEDPGWRMTCHHFKISSQTSMTSDIALTQADLTERLNFWIVSSLDHYSLLDLMKPDLDDEDLERIVRDAMVQRVMVR